MRKRKVQLNRTKFSHNNRRRLMLKRLHQKVLQRRQQYQQYDMFTDVAQAS